MKQGLLSVSKESFQVLEESKVQAAHSLPHVGSHGIQAECMGLTDVLDHAQLLLAEGSSSRWTQQQEQQQQHPRCFLDNIHNAAAKSMSLAFLWLYLSRCLLNTLVAHQTFSLYRYIFNTSSSSSYGSNSKAGVDAVDTRLIR